MTNTIKIKKMGVDLGNKTLKVAALVNNEFKTSSIDAIYNLDTAIQENTVEVAGDSIRLGVGTSTLSNVDKTKREFVEQHLLWSAHSIFGPGTHEISLTVGLPLNIYMNKEKRHDYKVMLEGISTIQGKVEGKDVVVNFSNVKVSAEGYAALRVVSGEITSDYKTLVLDMGYGTTDVLLMDNVNNKLSIEKYKSFNVGLQDIYKALSPIITKATGANVDRSLEEIDRSFLRTGKVKYLDKEVNLHDLLTEPTVVAVSKKLIDLIEEDFGELGIYNVIPIGGGSKYLEASLNQKSFINIEENTRLFANALGYALMCI